MNIQDISDFIDLVKNPDKYANVLAELQAEQGRLTAVIETVGKASELDSLRKRVEKQQAKLEVEFATKQKTLDEEYQAKQNTLLEQQQAVSKQAEEVRKQLEEANSKTLTAETISQTFSARDRALSKQESIVEAMKKDLAISAVEYNEKLAKLRSVMA
jgi:hypothetical protein